MNKKGNEDVEHVNTKGVIKDQEQSTSAVSDVPDTSMSTLILWNISKVIEQNPNINLKSALQVAQKQLESSYDVNAIISQEPGQRHLACALLAWQQLGHKDGDSLYRFVETKKNSQVVYPQKMSSEDFLMKQINSIGDKATMVPKATKSRSFDTSSVIGPVVKLPLETKVVMRVDNVQSSRGPAKNSKKEKEIMNRIDEACCLEASCVEQLSALDASTKELAARAAKLARREAERAELLERAEAAWKDLELGYHRRLVLAQEKEEDLSRQTRNQIEERNAYKSVCSTLTRELQERGDQAENDRVRLSKIEKEVCAKACERLRLSEASARQDSLLADLQCKAQQQDRDYQFQEEQARRKILNIESEVECVRALMIETERAVRAELSGLREQVSQVSKELLKEDANVIAIKKEIEVLQKEKQEIMEDLEGCKAVCDKRMEAKMEELKKKREILKELKAKVIECRCHLPVNTAVEVKRTPSLAALCRCKPEDKVLDSCSCTSLRSSLLSNLLSDLFAGLQSELGSVGPTMPCQLLKCLEDRHNWDRTSILKTNIRNFFSKLLMGELDIAIATSIEKYHAKWVGASCADASRPIPDIGGTENQGWQQRALERRAQTLASELAEQMFQEQADKLLKRAQDIVSKGPPPCECKPPHTALYPCLVGPQMIGEDARNGGLQGAISLRKVASNNDPDRCLISEEDANTATSMAGAVVATVTKTVAHRSGVTTPSYWRRTLDDVTQLKTQIEDLKKDSIKKDDLKIMEKNITKMIERFSGPTPGNKEEKKEIKNRRILPSDSYSINNRTNTTKKKLTDGNSRLMNKSSYQSDKQLNGKISKRPPQSYAVNLCLCGTQKYPTKLSKDEKCVNPQTKEAQSSNIKQTKPIARLPSQDSKNSKQISQESCRSDCVCLNKVPSNTSIDKLLETLTKWKCDLVNSQDSEFKKQNVLVSNPMICTDNLSTENSTKRSIRPQESTSQEIKTNDNQGTNLKKNGKAPELSNVNTIMTYIPNHNLVQGLDHLTVAATNSEYIGAVNLEKSDENMCNEFKNMKPDSINVISITCDSCKKCLNLESECNKTNELQVLSKPKNQVKTENINHNVEEKVADIPSQVNHNKKAKNSKNDLARNHKYDLKEVQVHTNNNFSENNANLSTYTANLEENDTFHLETGSHMRNCINSSTIDHIVKASDLFEYDCDYRIKFLGVTLANPTTDKKNENVSKFDYENINKNVTKVGKFKKNVNNSDSSDKNTENESKVGDKINNNNNLYENATATTKRGRNNLKAEKYWNDSLQYDTLENILLEGSKQNDDNISRQLQQPTCQCNAQFDEIKNFFDSAFNKQQYGDHISSKTKGLDAQSFEEIAFKQETCVCCFTYDKDESSNLEVNTFNLLEEHLKERLIEFKANCESSCMSPGEEDKMFSTLLNNIKQVISNSTNKIMCKCNDEDQIKGSWNRAYILLQEYLKTKIDRLQCKCLSPNKSKEKLLPVVTDEVCKLIEKDFERLKDIYKCQNRDNLKNTVNKDNISVDIQMPEKDINNNKNVPNILNNNNNQVSSQVSTMNKIDTKSCQNSKKDDQHIQTELIKKVDKCYSSEPDSCIHLSSVKKVVFNTSNTMTNLHDNSNPPLLAELSNVNRKLGEEEEIIISNTVSINNTNTDYVIPFKGKLSSEIPHVRKFEGIVINRTDNEKNVSEKFNMPSSAQSAPETRKLNTVIDEVHQKVITEQSEKIDLANNKGTSEQTSSLPFIGHTITCTCDLSLGSCECTKTWVQVNNATANNTMKQLSHKTEQQNTIFIMNNISQAHDDINHVDVSNNVYHAHNNIPEIVNLKPNNKNLCDIITSAHGEDDMTLKISTENNSKVHMNNATNTNYENVMCLDPEYNNYASADWYECTSQTAQDQEDANFTCIHCRDQSIKRVRSEAQVQLPNKKMKLMKVPRDCDCGMVPLCHVKMLMDNIENKLTYLECTCDSLSSTVCPIHSKRNMC